MAFSPEEFVVHSTDQLNDIVGDAVNKDFLTKEADRQSKRRMAEYNELERTKLVQKYAEMGVDVNADDSVQEANRKFRTFEQGRASNLLNHYTTQLNANAEQKKAKVAELLGLASKAADPMMAREALTVTLANPAAVKDIPSDQLAKLKAVLNGPGDPAKVVQKVYDYMQNDYWFRKGAAQNKASAFYQAYLTELNTRLDKSKQINAAVLMNELNDLDRSGQEIIKSRDQHIITAAPWLTKDDIAKSHDAHPIAPPANPADAFGAPKTPPSPPPSPTAPASAAATPAAPPTTESGVPGNASEAFESGGLPSMIGYRAKQAALGPDSLVSGGDPTSTEGSMAENPQGADVFTGLFGKFNPNLGQPITKPQAIASLPGRAGEKPLPVSGPAEDEALKKMAISMGAPQKAVADGEAAYQRYVAGDTSAMTPQMIAIHNMLLRRVRSQTAPGTGAPALMTAGPDDTGDQYPGQ